MDPHADVSERLFSAAKRATHFKELRTTISTTACTATSYETAALMKGVPVLRLLQDCDPSWRLIVVGDALMSPWELQSSGSRWSYGDDSGAPGIAWLVWSRRAFPPRSLAQSRAAGRWYGTAEVIRRVFRCTGSRRTGCSRRCTTSCAGRPPLTARGVLQQPRGVQRGEVIRDDARHARRQPDVRSGCAGTRSGRARWTRAEHAGDEELRVRKLLAQASP